MLGNERPAFIYQRYSVNNINGVLLADQLDVPFILQYNGSGVWINRNWGGKLKDEDTALRMFVIRAWQSRDGWLLLRRRRRCLVQRLVPSRGYRIAAPCYTIGVAGWLAPSYS